MSRSEGEQGTRTKPVQDEKDEKEEEEKNGRKRVKLVSNISPDLEVQGNGSPSYNFIADLTKKSKDVNTIMILWWSGGPEESILLLLQRWP